MKTFGYFVSTIGSVMFATSTVAAVLQSISSQGATNGVTHLLLIAIGTMMMGNTLQKM